jgi:hypothetical protein
MLVRILVVLLAPTPALAGTASGGGLVDGGPLFGGPRAIVYVRGEEYPVGQEVFLDVYVTSDLPGAEEKFLGRTSLKVKVGGKFFLSFISDPLPDTRFEWKMKYSFTRWTGDIEPPINFTARKKLLDKE